MSITRRILRMTNLTKEKIYFISLIILYTLFGLIGMYSGSLVFLFPILATPLALYLMCFKIQTKRAILLHAIVVVAIVLLTGRIDEGILYLVTVAVPGHMVAHFYVAKTPVPKTIMYVGIGVMGAFYLYTIGMRFLGLDYVGYYLAFVEDYKTIQMSMIAELTKNITDEQVLSQFQGLKEIVSAQVIILETIYPGLFLLFGVILATIQTLIMTVIGKFRKWSLPAFRDITRFTFAKALGILLILSFIIAQFSFGGNDRLTVLGLNLFFFLSSLLEILGFIAIIMLIKRKKWNKALKLIAVVFVIVLVFTFPTTFMIFGLADTLFNFRKVEIIV